LGWLLVHRTGAVGGLQHSPVLFIQLAETVGPGDLGSGWHLPPSARPQPEPYRQAFAALGLPAERVLFVAGSPYDIPGAGQVGMDIWWHNRVGMPARPGPRPIAEHRSLEPLPAFARGGGEEER